MSRKNYIRKLNIVAGIFGGLFIIMKAVAEKRKEGKDINDENPYLTESYFRTEGNQVEVDNYITGTRISNTSLSLYERILKPTIDRLLSFLGLVLLAPVFAMISAAIFLDDPGPIFFTQKRVGKDKEFFFLHKFRSMKMSTPHDVPTHQLSDPEQYITRVGRVLRKTSLDELPQIWDIFRGRMSIIGPRPALWNQDDLIRERDRYFANSVTPGLTGWAQINGRDELEIPDKAKLDGEYVKHLRQGGMKALFFDLKCFLGTVLSVAGGDGIVEGGTGEIHKIKAANQNNGRIKKRKTDSLAEYGAEEICIDDVGFEDYAYKKKFEINTSAENRKRVLITGANSYIGESFEVYARENYGKNFTIDTVDMIDGTWREKDFREYDCVFHVAGIAHADVGNVDEETKARYYAVNTDLAVETARKAKAEGVRQFVFMSSMIIYGEAAPLGKRKVIDEHTLPAPANFYGDSKWQADKRIRKLQGDGFNVAVLRPPMVYGREAKGNYRILVKLAKIVPVFPDIKNERSMIHIDNLCEFLCLLMLYGKRGVYFPQNKEYLNTSSMMKEIGYTCDRNVYTTKILNHVIRFASYIPGKMGRVINKAFGNNIYDQKLSIYEGLNYRNLDFRESIQQPKKGSLYKKNINTDRKKTHILVVSQYFYPETFRINDIATEWIKRGYKVTVLTGIPNYPIGKFFEGYNYIYPRREEWNGIEILRIPIIPRGNSSVGMVGNYFSFMVSGWIWKTITSIHADLVFTFEVSPMTQALIGCWYAKKYSVPHFLYVQDLWPENIESITGIHSKAVLKPIDIMVDYIYKNTDEIFTTSPAFVNAIVNRNVKVESSKVHFWPQYAEEFYMKMDKENIKINSKKGDTVNLIPNDNTFNIVFTGNIGTAQGLDILPKTAEQLKKIKICHNKREYNIRFIIIGNGRYQKNLEAEIRRRNVVESFILIPRQPAEEIPKLLACCDAAFVSFSNMEIWKKTIPAKLQSYMACGMPIIAAVNGETERIIRESECGICVNIGDSNGLVESIKELIINSNLDVMRDNSRRYCEKHFNKCKLMDEMDGWIESALELEFSSVGQVRC